MEAALSGVASVRQATVATPPLLRESVDGCDGGEAEPRLPPLKATLRPPTLSSKAFTSGGRDTWCTKVTAGQSAAGIIFCSWDKGGLQQPGQPGFWYPESLAEGLVRAHYAMFNEIDTVSGA